VIDWFLAPRDAEHGGETMGDATMVVETAAKVAGAATTALDFFDSIYERVERVRARRLSARNYLRAYYFEVVNNLELLAVVNAKRLSTLPVNSPVFRGLSIGWRRRSARRSCSRTRSTRLRLFALLGKKGRMENKRRMLDTFQKGVDARYAGKVLYENVLQAISFTVVKTEILRRLSRFSDGELDCLNQILLERRVTNIRERFSMIKSKLDELEGIREISR
jgi:hypothetical protein